MKIKEFMLSFILIAVINFMACESGEKSDPSLPGIPQNIVLTPSDGQITVIWNAAADADSYEVWYSETDKQSDSSIFAGDPIVTDTSCILTGLTNGIIYYVWIRAKNISGTGDFSDSFSAMPPLQPDDRITVSVGNLSFNMSQVPGSLLFYTGRYDDDIRDMPFPAFQIAETETTNEVVCAVFQWAYNNGKFDTDGDGDIDGDDASQLSDITVILHGQKLLGLSGQMDGVVCGISFNNVTFSTKPGEKNKPCIYVTWYGAIMFCNWLTEMVDGNTENLVYTWTDGGSGGSAAADGKWNDDETTADNTKKGFRLPESMEWELAARYISDTNGNGDIIDQGEYYPGNHASGDITSYCCPYDGSTSDIFGNYAWYDGNSSELGSSHADYGTHIVGTSGISMTDQAADPEPKSGQYKNALGLYDMSGNVREWCFNKNDYNRVLRGGCWCTNSFSIEIGSWFSYQAYKCYNNLGFRIFRTE